jgi:hypothetical protein
MSKLPEGWEIIVSNPQTLDDCKKLVEQTRKRLELSKDLPEQLANSPYKENHEFTRPVIDLYRTGIGMIKNAEKFILNPKKTLDQKKKLAFDLYTFVSTNIFCYLDSAEAFLIESKKFTLKEK